MHTTLQVIFATKRYLAVKALTKAHANCCTGLWADVDSSWIVGQFKLVRHLAVVQVELPTSRENHMFFSIVHWSTSISRFGKIFIEQTSQSPGNLYVSLWMGFSFTFNTSISYSNNEFI